MTVAIVNAEPAGQEHEDEPTALVLPSGQGVHAVDCATLKVLDGHAARHGSTSIARRAPIDLDELVLRVRLAIVVQRTSARQAGGAQRPRLARCVCKKRAQRTGCGLIPGTLQQSARVVRERHVREQTRVDAVPAVE